MRLHVYLCNQICGKLIARVYLIYDLLARATGAGNESERGVRERMLHKQAFFMMKCLLQVNGIDLKLLDCLHVFIEER